METVQNIKTYSEICKNIFDLKEIRSDYLFNLNKEAIEKIKEIAKEMEPILGKNSFEIVKSIFSMGHTSGAQKASDAVLKILEQL